MHTQGLHDLWTDREGEVQQYAPAERENTGDHVMLDSQGQKLIEHGLMPCLFPSQGPAI
jgi:hypothetical protein